jgi:hypothetical protein
LHFFIAETNVEVEDKKKLKSVAKFSKKIKFNSMFFSAPLKTLAEWTKPQKKRVFSFSEGTMDDKS